MMKNHRFGAPEKISRRRASLLSMAAAWQQQRSTSHPSPLPPRAPLLSPAARGRCRPADPRARATSFPARKCNSVFVERPRKGKGRQFSSSQRPIFLRDAFRESNGVPLAMTIRDRLSLRRVHQVSQAPLKPHHQGVDGALFQEFLFVRQLIFNNSRQAPPRQSWGAGGEFLYQPRFKKGWVR